MEFTCVVALTNGSIIRIKDAIAYKFDSATEIVSVDTEKNRNLFNAASVMFVANEEDIEWGS